MPVEHRVTDGPENTINDLPDQPSHERRHSRRIVLTGEQTNGAFTMIDAVERRENEPPLHLHTREDEIIYVMSGAIEVSLDGNRSEHIAGEAVFLPKGREHSYLLRSETARLFHISAPAGIEGFYRELDRTMAQDQYVERLITLAAHFGIEITGPGLRETATDTEGA
jgi:quercetin dioxygenase-like cupin family protein